MIVLQGARERVEVLRFSPDGRALVAPCSAGVQVWDDPAAGGRPAAVLGHRHVWADRFTPDGRKLVLAQFGVLVHDWATGEAAEVPLELPGQGAFCDLTPDGRFLVAAQADYRSNPPGRLFCRPLADPATSVWSLATGPVHHPPLFLAGGERFVVLEWRCEPGASRYGPVYVTREARTGQALAEVAGRGDDFSSPFLSADRRLVACRRGVRVSVFRADDFRAGPVTFRNDSRKEFTGLAFHPSGRYLAATSNDATVKLYDTATWAVAGAFDWDIGRLRSVAFSPDGMLAAAGGDRGKVVVWDLDL